MQRVLEERGGVIKSSRQTHLGLSDTLDLEFRRLEKKERNTFFRQLGSVGCRKNIGEAGWEAGCLKSETGVGYAEGHCLYLEGCLKKEVGCWCRYLDCCQEIDWEL